MTNKRLSKTQAENLDSIPNLAPGDFKIVRDQSRLLPNGSVTNLDLIQALAEESQHKKQARTQSIGFTI